MSTEYVKNASRLLRGEMTELEQIRQMQAEQLMKNAELEKNETPTRESVMYDDMGTRTMEKLIIDRRPLVKKDKTMPNDPCPCGSGKKFKKCCMGRIDYTGYVRMTKKSS